MPEITSDTQSRKITVQTLVFEAPQPYNEGDEINTNEAAALNQTFAENLRNNFSGKARELIKEAGGADAVDMSMAQVKFWDYAEAYEFGVRSTSGAPGDPVETEARGQARVAVRKALQKAGYKLKDVTKERMNELIANALETHPQFRAKAKEIVAAREMDTDLELSL